MSGKKKKRAPRGRSREVLRKAHEAQAGHGQRMLERGASCREIARELGRSPSTVSAEVASHRFVTAPKARRGERVDASADLSAACPRLAAWPRCCNGCGRYRAIGCKRRPHVFYEARAAQLCADSVLVSSRRGIDARRARRGGQAGGDKGLPAPGLSPEQLSARNGGPVDLSPSTIYRWVAAGYDGMTNMELRRKVGYRPRRRAAGRAATRHPPAGRTPRSSAWARTRAPPPGRWTPSRARGRTAPACSRCCTAPAGCSSRCRWRRRPPGASRTPWAISGRSSAPTGRAGCSRAVLTDNGAEFSDEAAIAALLGEGPGETRLFYCDPRRSDQKGACERNHVEIRKLLPKGRRPQVRPARPGRPGAGHVARELRSPRRARLRDARARLQGDGRGGRGGAAGRLRRGGRGARRSRPDAGAHREGARREGDAPLAQPRRKNGIDGPTVRLSLGRGAGRRAEHGHRTHRNTSPPFLQLGKRRPRTPGGAAGAFG